MSFLKTDTSEIRASNMAVCVKLELLFFYKCDIVISVEEYWSPKGLEKLYRHFTEEYYTSLLKKKFGREFIESKKNIAINAGQIIGYVKSLKKLFAKTTTFMKTKIDDDQAALYSVLLPYFEGEIKKAPFKLDFKCTIFGTLSNEHQYNRDFKWDEKKKAWKYIPTNSYPVSLHFAGEQRQMYE